MIASRFMIFGGETGGEKGILYINSAESHPLRLL